MSHIMGRIRWLQLARYLREHRLRWIPELQAAMPRETRRDHLVRVGAPASASPRTLVPSRWHGDPMETSDEQQPENVQTAAPEQLERLAPGVGGVWLVSSRKGTTHLWDLDAKTYRRQPGPGSSRMAYDNTTVPIPNVGAWPEVGGRALVFLDDPQNPFMAQWRFCSAIRSITRINDSDARG